ncbi:ankyrin [Perilla frutescens var. frutescens]|nr:ankyrin [Perilla frutescens var. frutescens]
MNQNKNSWGGLMKQHSDWLERTKSTLMIVATLIATMTFQVGVNPPGGVWQEDQIFDRQGNEVSDPYYAAIARCYVGAVGAVTPYNDPKDEETRKPTVRAIEITIIGWLILMGLLLIAHTIRMIVKLIKKCKKLVFRRRRFGSQQNGNNITAV